MKQLYDSGVKFVKDVINMHNELYSYDEMVGRIDGNLDFLTYGSLILCVSDKTVCRQ